MLHILAVSPYYEPEGGGLERYAHAILSRLATRGHEVTALTATRGASDAMRHEGVQVQRLRAPVRVGNTPIDPWFGVQVAKAIRAASPDLVVGHTPVPYAAEMAYLAARRHGIPFVTTYHAGGLHGSSRILEGLATLDRMTLQRLMLSGSARLIAVSPYVRDHALGAHRDRVTVVPPGVDAARFSPDGRPEGPEILFVGPLSRSYRWKGVDVLWRAFDELRRSVPDARLTLVGDGDRRAEFEAKAERSGGAVRLVGRLSDEGLIAAYRRAAVVVLPSTSDAESFGMVLAEANACGRPVVASDIGGIPSFVTHGENGWLVPPGDAAALARRLASVLQDPEAAAEMGMRGRRRVLAAHDWDRLAAATEGVLLDAVQAPR